MPHPHFFSFVTSMHVSLEIMDMLNRVYMLDPYMVCKC